jgi:hypothetical protein
MDTHPVSREDKARGLLAAILEEFEDELNASPTLGEMLEIMGTSVPSTEETAGILVPVRFTTTLANGRRYRPRAESRVGELNDSAFVHASALVVALMGDGNAAVGPEVGAEYLAGSLLELLHATATDFVDVRSSDIASLEVVGPSRAIRAKIGDVVAIPARGRGFHLASIVARNKFGTGIGVWRDARPAPRFNALEEPLAFGVFYTDDMSIKNGHWPVIGYSELALSKFPTDPELYYKPDSYTGFGPKIGEFGSAEKPDGTLRDVTKEEASRVGLLDGTYRQVYTSLWIPELLE